MTDAATPAHRLDRRTVLRGAGAGVVVAGTGLCLAACATVAPNTANAEIDGSSARVPTADVPEGGGTILTNAAFVVTQPEAGSYKAFTKICTHQQCPVAEILDGAILCTCHGSEFSIADGSVLRGPATKPLAEYPTTVENDEVVVNG